VSSKRRQRRKACRGKVRYPGQREAAAAARRGRVRGHWLLAYRCPFCTGHHIGHPTYQHRQAARHAARERRRAA
jgi:hypothetical protein